MASSTQHPVRTAVLAVGAVGAAAAVWGIGIERHLYTLRRHTVAVLAPGSAPIRVLHISDVHMAPWQRRKQAWIASLASLRPDLIINTGDNLGHPDAVRGIRAAFAGFRGIPGAFVHGSNDLFASAPRNPLRYFLGPSKNHSREVRLDTEAMDSFFTSTATSPAARATVSEARRASETASKRRRLVMTILGDGLGNSLSVAG